MKSNKSKFDKLVSQNSRMGLNEKMSRIELKERRKSFNLTQKQLAELLQITPNHISRMEVGGERVSKHTAIYLRLINIK